MQRVAQRLLLLGAVASIAALLYSVWHRWPGLVDETAWRELLLWYAFPLLSIAATLTLAGLWPKADRLFLLNVAGSVVVGLLTVEIYLQYVSYDRRQDAARSAAIRLDMPFDERSAAEVIAAFRRSGERAFPIARIVTDPQLVTLGTMPHAVVVDCNEFGPWYTPKTDRYGFVNSDAIWADRTRLDAVVVGDSFAMGECDPITGGIVEILRNRGHRVLNLSMAGNDPLLNLGSLVEFGSMYESRLVFWLHFAGNDLEGLEVNARQPVLLRYLEDPTFRQNLADRMPEVEKRLSALEKAALRPHRSFLSALFTPKRLSSVLRLYALRTIFGMAPNIEGNHTFLLLERIMKRARRIADGMGAKLIVISIPSAPQVDHESAAEARTADVVSRSGVEFVDLKPLLRRTGHQDLYSQRYMGHFTPTGNELVAGLLSTLVSEAK